MSLILHQLTIVVKYARMAIIPPRRQAWWLFLRRQAWRLYFFILFELTYPGSIKVQPEETLRRLIPIRFAIGVVQV